MSLPGTLIFDSLRHHGGIYLTTDTLRRTGGSHTLALYGPGRTVATMYQNCIWQHIGVFPLCSKASGTGVPESRGRRLPAIAQASQCAPEASNKPAASQRRAFRFTQTLPLLALTQLHAESLWSNLCLQPHTQRQWLEHIYRLNNRESLEAGTQSQSPGPSITAVQLGRPLLSFNGCPRGDKDPEFYANVGSAIRTLRDEIPTLFQKDLTCEPRCASPSCCAAADRRLPIYLSAVHSQEAGNFQPIVDLWGLMSSLVISL